jgi:2-oxoglutarate ferredoxin oxidoreductase subunit alpha
MDRLLEKHKAAAKWVPEPEFLKRHDVDGKPSRFGVITLGGCDNAVREAIDVLARQKIEVDYMRIKAFPFGHDVETFLSVHATIFVVEQNRDAQLRSLLTLETPVPKEKLKSVLIYGGFPLSSSSVVKGILSQI